MLVSINEIKINPGRREATLVEIQELARSISEVKLLIPLHSGKGWMVAQFVWHQKKYSLHG